MAIQPSTSGASTPGIIPATTGVESETPQSLAQGTGQSTSTKQPTLNLFQDDNVARSSNTPKASLGTDNTSSTTKPFSNYSLPGSELQTPKGQTPADAEDFSAMLSSEVTAVLGGLAKPDGMNWVTNRAAYFNANPDQGVLTAFLADPANQAALTQGLQQAFDTQSPSGDVGATLGETAHAYLSATQSVLFDTVAAAMLNKPIPAAETVSRLASIGLTPTQAKNLGLEHLLKQGSTPNSAGIIDANGKIDPKLLSKFMAGPFAGMVEASLEFYLGVAGSMLKGDIDKDINVMSARLKDLQAEKAVLLKNIVGREAAIAGQQKSASEASKAAERAAERAKAWGLIGAIVAMVVAVVTAVVLTIVSFGTAAPLAICGVVILSASVMSVVAVVAAVAAIVVAVVTIIQMVPQILQVVALIAKALGNEELAQQLEEATDAYDKFMKESGFGKVLDEIKKVCGYILFCCSAATAVASLGNVATQAAFEPIKNVLNWVSIGANIIGCAANAAKALADKDVAAATKALEMARAELAEIELQIKEYFQKVNSAKSEEDDIKEGIENLQGLQAKITENVGKAAESLSILRTSVATVFS